MQEWIDNQTPDKEGEYLCYTDTGIIMTLHWCKGWNCFEDPTSPGIIMRDNEITVLAWMHLPKPYIKKED